MYRRNEHILCFSILRVTVCLHYGVLDVGRECGKENEVNGPFTSCFCAQQRMLYFQTKMPTSIQISESNKDIELRKWREV